MSDRSSIRRGQTALPRATQTAQNTPVVKNTTSEKVVKDTNSGVQTSFKDGRLQSHFEREKSTTQNWNTSYSTESEHGSSGKVSGAMAGLLGQLPKVGVNGEFTKGAAVAKYEGGFGDANSVAQGHGKVSLLEAELKGSGEVGIEGGKLFARGDLDAKATLVDAEGTLRAGVGPVQAELQGKAWVGAKAGLHGEVTVDPINGKYAARVGGDAFIGARAGVTGNVKLGDFGGVTGRAEAWAGVGVSARAEASWDNGRFKARVDFGAALGVGFKLGFDVDINFKKIGEAVTSVIEKPIEAAKNVLKSVGNFFKGLFG
ncbi:hypothetical protein LZ198_25255 [Myxococcus sp. K15C18031901]|uniref:hypothetical protein n=1 Tax=Myxococcus dinghuensis TaxID=2906761 RepID=UPI0020A6FC32|nr:hypothetical protein [Myxococcus dinghuensis]MCP3102181.1 hypothetical protein [Myxococcus dinghuensis]